MNTKVVDGFHLHWTNLNTLEHKLVDILSSTPEHFEHKSGGIYFQSLYITYFQIDLNWTQIGGLLFFGQQNTLNNLRNQIQAFIYRLMNPMVSLPCLALSNGTSFDLKCKIWT